MFTRHTHHMLGFVVAIAATLAMVPQATHADGLIVVDHPTTVPAGHYRFAPLVVKHHHVNVTINDQVAMTHIDQVFHNPNNQQLEGTYLFPIPKNAQIDQFTMDVNGVQMEAELLDADKARQIYTDIVRSMRDPALLEYVGQGLFKVRIFPIEARSDKHVTLKYTQVLSQDSGMNEYVYPLNTEKFSAAPVESVAIKINLQTTEPLDALYCPSHAAEIKRQNPNEAVIGFEASHVRPDTDFTLFFSTKTSGGSPVGLSLLTYRDDPEQDGYFMLLASPQAHIADDQIQPKDIIFVLDTSGSMAGEKLTQAKRALNFCLANLNEDDQFEIVRFSTEADGLFGELRDVNETSIQEAGGFIDKLKPIGGTAIDEALQLAANAAKSRSDSNRPCMVIFLTDGRPTIGTTDEKQILAKLTAAVGDQRLRVFCFGIGTDINTHLLDRIAQQTRAVPQYVLPDEDIEIKVSNFYAKVDSPVLVEPTLRFNGGVRMSKAYPRDLPDVFKGDQILILGRYSGSGDAAIVMDGIVNSTTQSIVHEGTFPEASEDNAFIARLWATRRIGFLLDEIRLHGESDELRDEVTRLARLHGIVTPYTAYLIVEDEARRNVPLATRSLSELSRDVSGRQRAEEYLYALRDAESGAAAVDASNSAGQLKQAGRQLQPPPGSPAVGGGSGGAGGDVDFFAGLALTTADAIKLREIGIQASRMAHVHGRTFYLNRAVWVDAAITDALANGQELRRIAIAFGSDAYFQLFEDHPKAAKWLSLGERIDLRLGDVIYEIAAPDDM